MSREITEKITSFPMKPIGYVRTSSRYRYEAPRQPAFSGTEAMIEFIPGNSYEAAAKDLAGFDRIWVIFCFHLNTDHWNPFVRPPVSPDGGKYGVFATRSPHRPNPIGMSCVEVISIEKKGIRIRNSDMLDGTPVFDIKPYIPEVDAFPDSRAGWHDRIQDESFQVDFTEDFREKSAFLLSLGAPDMAEFSRVQLRFRPLDSSRKRLTPPEKNGGLWGIGCRTFRILFSICEEEKKIRAENILSNYSPGELLPDAEDKYGDKAVHREFLRHFPEKQDF